MTETNNVDIITKAVEISKSLVNTTGMHTYDLAVTRELGDLARFAITIKGARQLAGDFQLAAISDAMKIDYAITRSVILNSLEKFGWVEISRDGSKISEVLERVPPMEDVIETLGQEWTNRTPSKIDEASVKALTLLCDRPYQTDAMESELNLPPDEFESVLGYGNQANYLGNFKSEETGKDVLWSPLYWLGKADSVEKYLSKQHGLSYANLAQLQFDIKQHQGMPIEMISQHRDLVDSGVHFGFFPSVKVGNPLKGTEYEYVFTAVPQFEPQKDKDVFEQARLIVACIRQGQYHPETTPIHSPKLILQAMRQNRLRSHSHHKDQYIILKLHNIIDLVPGDFGPGTRVKWIDTPETKIAADIADLMLSGRNPAIATAEEVEAAKVLVQGVYNYSAEQRRIKTGKTISAEPAFRRMVETLLGVRR